MRQRWLILAMAVVLLIGAGARFYKLDEKSLWSDEVATMATASGHSIDPDAFALRGESFDPVTLVEAHQYLKRAFGVIGGTSHLGMTSNVLKDNVHPPLFFWMMGGWLNWGPNYFGRHAAPTPDEWAGFLRIPAVIFGILAIVFLQRLGMNLLAFQDKENLLPGRGWGLLKWKEERLAYPARAFGTLAAAMLAFSAYQVDHAQDARQYTLLVLAAILAGSVVYELVYGALKGREKWFGWLFLALLLTVGLYTQYFFVVFAGFIFCYLAWQERGNKQSLLKLAACAGLVGLLFLFWLSYFKAQLLFLKGAGHYTAGLWDPVQLPEKLWRIFCEFFLPKSPVGKLVPAVILLTAGGAWLSQKPWRKAASEKPWWQPGPVLGFILFWLVAVVGGQIVIDLLKDSHTATIRRYLLLASPAAYLLMAYALTSMGKAPGRWWKGAQVGLTVLLLGLMLGDTARYLFKEHESSDEFKQAAAVINQVYQPEDVVLVSKSGAMAVGMAYYLKPMALMLGVHVPEYSALVEGGPLMRKLERSVAGRKRVWLVFSHAAPSTQQRLTQWLEGRGYRQEAVHKTRGVKVINMGLKKPG